MPTGTFPRLAVEIPVAGMPSTGLEGVFSGDRRAKDYDRRAFSKRFLAVRGGFRFFVELRRRHVWRVAIAYAITAWLLLQLASIVLPAFASPDWILKALIVIFVIFFPLALLLAWAYEITPEGIRRTEPEHSPLARSAHDARAVRQKLDTGIIVALVLAVALLLANTFIWQVGMRAPAVATATPATAAGQAIPAKSIAVLPFQNLSDDKDNDYFVAGIQDLIITKLAGISDLKVISRTSTMRYASHPQNLKVVGQQLGVASILEGSVQKSGDQVLINVQLIDASTDSQIWAESYTRTLDNIFGVEDEVADKVADALHARLAPRPSTRPHAPPTTNRVAYDLFLRAEFQVHREFVKHDWNHMKGALELYRKAVKADPLFALAFARLSDLESLVAFYGGGGENIEALKQQALEDARQALRLAPDLPAARLALGYYYYRCRRDYAAALKAFDAVLASDPNNAEALAAQGYVQRRQGRFNDAIASLSRAVALDPRDAEPTMELGTTYMMMGRYAQAQTWLQHALALEPDSASARRDYSAAILFASGDVKRALAAAHGTQPDLQLWRVSLLTYQRKYRDAIALLKSIPATGSTFAPAGGASKVQQLAVLYWLAGDKTQAGKLFAQSMLADRAALAWAHGIDLAGFWNAVANDEWGTGHTREALAAIAHSQAILDQTQDAFIVPNYTIYNAQTYGMFGRADLAVPLLAKVLATRGTGFAYAPVMLWLDPAWGPIRDDPRFQALLKTYAAHKPATPRPL